MTALLMLHHLLRHGGENDEEATLVSDKVTHTRLNVRGQIMQADIFERKPCLCVCVCVCLSHYLDFLSDLMINFLMDSSVCFTIVFDFHI